MPQVPRDPFGGQHVAAGEEAVALAGYGLDLVSVRLQLADRLPDGGAAQPQLLREGGAGHKGVRVLLQDFQDLFFRHAGISSFDATGHRRFTSAAARTILIPSGIR